MKSLAQSNQRLMRAWQLTLGPVQVALLLGVVLGCMACAFYLGFFSGQKVGIEVALDNNISNAMRLPIALEEEDTPLAPEEGLNDVYAKLKQLETSDSPLVAGSPRLAARGDTNSLSELLDARKKGGEDTIKAKPDQDLGSITVVDTEAPRAPENLHARADTATLEDASLPLEHEISPIPAEKSVKVRVLGEEDPAKHSHGTGVTLGSLAEKSSEQAAQEKTQGTLPLAKSALAPVPNAVVSAKVETRPQANTGKSEVITEPKKAPLKAVEPPTKKLAPALPQTLPRGWFAQVGAPDKRADADALVRKLRASGFPVIIENAKVRGQEYFRVLVGPEETKQQAERLLSQLKREPSIKADPFLRMVR